MALDQWSMSNTRWRQLLNWVNLRPEESERTLFMFAFYTTTSIGLVWLEACTIALFLETYGAENGLPWIYIASAAIGSGLGFLYSRLQSLLPLRWVIVLTGFLIALPIFLFRLGLNNLSASGLGMLTLAAVTIFLMRLWLEAIYVLSDLNTSITANQLFNIREIKRTFPLISSGILVADVISGFSLTFLIQLIGLKNVVVLAALMMVIGAIILLYLGKAYRRSFPDNRHRHPDLRQSEFSHNRQIRGPLQRYVVLLVLFFILAQVLFLLIDFQFLAQLQQRNTQEQIAIFLGFFSGVLGIFELSIQWLVSSRVIERIGVFAAAQLLPLSIAMIGSIATIIASFSLKSPLFISLVVLKFLDELFHYTLFTGISPVLFQPIPDTLRSRIQSGVRGIAEPLSTGATGLALLGLVWFSHNSALSHNLVSWLFPAIVFLAVVWLITISLLRTNYVGLLVIGAERGQLSGDVDLRALQQAVIEALEQPGTEAHKRSCIELLIQLDPKNVSSVLGPLLIKLPPSLQRQILEAMLAEAIQTQSRGAYLNQVRQLINPPTPPEVRAVALRYVWLTESDPDLDQLQPYLQPNEDPIVRGTAASLMLRRGTSIQKAEATNTLRLMLMHREEQERIMGCRALAEAMYLQALRVHIPKLLQDESLRVRCALLDAIAATHLEEYYPSLLKGLQYKSTRESAMRALVRLEDEAIPMLVKLAEDHQKPGLVKLYAWKTIGQIGSPEALNVLVSHLSTNWGTDRGRILKILLEMPNDAGIEGTLERIGRQGTEQLIDQEMLFIAQLSAAAIDLQVGAINNLEEDLLHRALRDLQTDAEDRLFQLLKFLYPINTIKAAAFNLQSSSRSSRARGLEILDNTLDLAHKRLLLSVFDRPSDQETLPNLSGLNSYQPLSPQERLRRLVSLRYFLSDWALACCFHLARRKRWGIAANHTLACLKHPRGFVREAVLAYLAEVYPRILERVLPMLKTDPDSLVADQVRKLTCEVHKKS